MMMTMIIIIIIFIIIVIKLLFNIYAHTLAHIILTRKHALAAYSAFQMTPALDLHN